MTMFIRLLDASVDEKAAALKAAVEALRDGAAPAGNPYHVFECSSPQVAQVPGSPFAYWVSEAVRSLFVKLDRFEADTRTVKQGLATADDFRFVRTWWEVAPKGMGEQWFPFAKGGAHSPYYADVFLCVNWGEGGGEIKSNLNANGSVRSNVWMLRDTATKYFFRPGLTWPRRTNGFSVRAMPRGCIFADKGPGAFVENDDSNKLLSFSALLNSRPFGYLVGVQLARTELAQSYEVGLIQKTPVPELSDTDIDSLATLARRAWSLKHSLDTVNETSHAFLLPPGLNERITGLNKGAAETELAHLQRQIDDRAFELYGIGPDDGAIIEAWNGSAVPAEDASDENADEDDENEPAETAEAGESEAVVSWLVGVALGRFDSRLATGERAAPPVPEPFDPRPPRSPGMWPQGEEPKDAPAILVDDEGHAEDLTARVNQEAERVRWQPPEDVRAWLAREFFPQHVKRYSKSRRKAPIYWQLATPSGRYSVWLYLHAFTKDTLFRVQHDYARPKLLHEERRLETLRQEAGENPSAAQRKQIAAQESFVEELRVFLEEVERVAPLWNPNLDDGVIINFAPLLRLVPQNKSWQKELKATWDALCAEKYDWAHLAMHLWPERVVPKCAKDRSLAIAHGIEEVFWIENSEGKWVARELPTRSIEELIHERTSPAVNAALETLLQAPVAQNGHGRSRRRRAITRGA
jgi:hypothetical protein